jgi:vancomycin resistance protein YoaR
VTVTPDQQIDARLADENNGGRVVLLLILGLFVLFGGAYVAAYAYAADNVPRGTTVDGIDIGGRSRASAEQALANGLSERASAPIRLTAGAESRLVRPEEAGLSVDFVATVAEAGGGRSWDPKRLWDYYTGGQEVEPVVDLDPAAMQTVLGDLRARAGRKPVEGAVTFVGGEVRTTQPEPGTTFDPTAAAAAIQKAYLTPSPTVSVPLQPWQPTIGDAAVQRALDSFANPAVSSSLTLDFGKNSLRLSPAEFTRAITLEVEGKELRPSVDPKLLESVIDARLGGHGAPQDATVKLIDGKPTVVPDKPGIGYDATKVAADLVPVLSRTGTNRRLPVVATVEQAKFKTADAQRLGITKRVSTFTTYFPYAEYRNVNIGRAGQLINGTIIKPGETFSLNGVVGERTPENGFTTGFIIEDGIFKEDYGGGVSQMATTTFNAAFFAGMTDIEHHTHSLYIDRYPIGREATVAWGSKDLRWRNDTPYGVLVEAQLTPSTPSSSGVVTVSIYSTKYWDITTKTGSAYNFTPYKTRTLGNAGCHENSGSKGFDIDIWRYWRKHGSSELLRTEKMHTTYIPADTVICTNPDHT